MIRSGRDAAYGSGAPRRSFRTGFTMLAGVTAVIACTTLAAFVVRPARGEVSGALIFLVGIMVAGGRWGLGAGLLAATASFLLYNFYFAEPVLTFRLDTANDFIPLLVFNVSAGIAGLLAGQLRDQARATAAANQSLGALLRISRALQSALTAADIEQVLTGFPPLGTVRLRATDPPTGSAQAAITISPASDGDKQESYRINCAEQVIELDIAPAGDQAQPIGPALANLVALALERACLADRLAETEAAARTQGLQSSLLSSVSHDFRTPLSTISASASSLLAYRQHLDREVEDNLLSTIMEESERLNRFTANLLEMSKLEAGQAPSGEILSASEIIAAAMRAIRARAGNRTIERTGNEDCFLIADPAMFELALINVLENALLYSDDRSRICIDLRRQEASCVIEIADEGRGIPSSDLSRVFDRFYRVDATAQMPRGSGLGLAIARGFVQAYGGSVSAHLPGIGDRGTTIRITLPITDGVAP